MQYSVNTLGDVASNQAPRFLPVETASVRLHLDPAPSRHALYGVLANLSDTGACVIANASVPEGPVVVAISLGRLGARELTVAGRVVWCAERLEPVKGIVGYLTGVRFEDAADQAIRELLDSGSFQPPT